MELHRDLSQNSNFPLKKEVERRLIRGLKRLKELLDGAEETLDESLKNEGEIQERLDKIEDDLDKQDDGEG